MRPERRLVAHAAADRRPQFAEIDVRHAREHVAGVDEADHAEPAGDRHAQFGVEDDQAVAADRQQVLVERVGQLRRIVARADAVEQRSRESSCRRRR